MVEHSPEEGRVTSSILVLGTIPPVEADSTSNDHGLRAIPRAFLSSRNRFEPNTFAAIVFFSVREPFLTVSPSFSAVLTQFWNGSSHAWRGCSERVVSSIIDFFRARISAFWVANCAWDYAIGSLSTTNIDLTRPLDMPPRRRSITLQNPMAQNPQLGLEVRAPMALKDDRSKNREGGLKGLYPSLPSQRA